MRGGEGIEAVEKGDEGEIDQRKPSSVGLEGRFKFQARACGRD